MKKIFSIILSLTMLLSITTSFNMTGFASTADTYISANSVNAEKGNRVSVAFKLYNNTGIWGIKLKIHYDNSALTLNSVTTGTVFNSGEFVMSENLSKNPYIITANGGNFTNKTTNGTIFTMNFTVNSNALKKNYPITAEIEQAIDVDGNEIDITANDGVVNIVDCQSLYITNTVKATTSKNGYVEKKCATCGKTISKTIIYYPKTFTFSTSNYVYTGSVRTPSVTVKDYKGKTLKKNTDYTVSYASGRKYVGKYAVKVTFKGNYSGTKTMYFYIKPQTAKINTIKSYDNAFYVKWNKISSQITGYQMQYSTSSKFTKTTTRTISYKTLSYKQSKLANKKKYYVRVRAYKKVGSTNYYGSWSTVKYVTTK